MVEEGRDSENYMEWMGKGRGDCPFRTHFISGSNFRSEGFGTQQEKCQGPAGIAGRAPEKAGRQSRMRMRANPKFVTGAFLFHKL